MRNGVAIALALLVTTASPHAMKQAQAPTRATLALGELSKSLEELAARVSPCVVQIFVTGYAPPEEQSEGGTGEPAIERTSGSGAIVDADGYIVTNAHVVENATRLEVELSSATSGVATGRSIVKRRGRIVPARIVAIDHETDLAVIKIETSGLPTLRFGDSDLLRPGQIVMAFGSPMGLDSSVTMGVVSAVARQLQPDDPMIYVQTDAPINPGNSGGPLIDTEGRLVGINTLIFTQGGGSEGIGFAAPSNIVRNVFTQIRKSGHVLRGEIGITAQTITPLLAEALQLSGEGGVIVSDVDPDGPADKAGVKPGDLVLSLDGKTMENGRQLRVDLYSHAVGEAVTLELLRGDARQSVTISVKEREDDPGRLAQMMAVQKQLVALAPLGVTAVDMNDRIAKLLPDLREKTGAVVVAIAADAPYSQQGKLKPGDVIRGLNGKHLATVAYLLELTKDLKPGSPVALQIERGGDYLYFAFRAK